MHYTRDQINDLEKIKKINLINSCSGYKSANLIGTISKEGITNVAVFSSVTHLGSNPPTLGFIIRPTTVPRDTYKNILESGIFTINHVYEDILEDGSIRNRTTRGNKALWYHHDGMKEIMITLELARRHGFEIPKKLVLKVEKAGELFIKAFQDHSYLNKWAKIAHNSVYTPDKQEYLEWLKKGVEAFEQTNAHEIQK